MSYFKLENQGLIDGAIEIQYKDKELFIEPSEFVIKPGQTETIKCNFKKKIIISEL